MSEVIKGLNLLDVVFDIGSKSKKFQAITLTKIEEIMRNPDFTYDEIRKVILDQYNEYTKSILRTLFGTDFEYIKK